MVGLKGSPGGPRPLRVSGKATSRDPSRCDLQRAIFDTQTLVKGERLPLPPARQRAGGSRAGADVTGELDDRAKRGAAARSGLKSLPPASARRAAVLDPLGQLSQRGRSRRPNTARATSILLAAPPVAGARRFAVTAALGRDELPHGAGARHRLRAGPVLEMSDDEKPTAPSFEAMEAGLRIGEARERRSNAGHSCPARLLPADHDHAAWIDVDAVNRFSSGAHALAPPAHRPRDDERDHAHADLYRERSWRARAPVRRVGRARFAQRRPIEPGASIAPSAGPSVPIADGPAAAVDPEVRTPSASTRARSTGSTAQPPAGQIVPAVEVNG